MNTDTITIIVPKNATNFDVIKTVFPNYEEITVIGDNILLERYFPYCRAQLSKDWLNAPYRTKEG